MRRISYVCGSLGNINWTSSGSGTHMSPREGPAYREHFGANNHNYSHWLSLNHTAGWMDLARFLFMIPEAASPAKRDATPLRLLSWLSFRLDPAVDKLIEATMLRLSTVDEVKDSELLALGRIHLEADTPFASAEALRDHLIELISVRNLRHRPEALFALFRQFLQRLTLPRICHFLDLVLPQLTPVRAPWADATRTLWTCHHIRASSHANRQPYEPRVTIAYFFTSHDHIHHVRVLWGILPLLLFSDPRMVNPVNVYDFQGQAAHRLHKQHIQMGLRKGMAVLVYYRVEGGPHVNEVFQAVLIAHESAAIRGKKNDNKLWKRVVTNPDCHFLAVLTALVQSILEGRTDCPISGVFGAGKTRAAAAMIAGLLVMDPTLKVMVVTKENAAAHAFAKHIESLQLPPSLEEKFGRLVGATELEKGPASQSKLDILPGFRNTGLAH